MQIGELARRFAVAPSKIRFLEDEGLVRPVRRTEAGYREYDESSAEALAMILQAQSLGFTLDEIKGALAETKESWPASRLSDRADRAETDRTRPSHRAGARAARAAGLRQQRTQDAHEERSEMRRKACGYAPVRTGKPRPAQRGPSPNSGRRRDKDALVPPSRPDAYSAWPSMIGPNSSHFSPVNFIIWTCSIG